MRKDRPEWQLFLEEISIPISKSELSDPLKLAIVLEIFQKVFKSVEEKRCVINWIRQMSDHLGTYVSNGRNEIQMLDEQLKTLYLKIDNLKHNFRENPDKITMELSFTNQKISTLKDKKYLFAQIIELLNKEYALALKNEHIFQQALRTLPESFLLD